MPEDRESKRGKGDGKSKVHKACLCDDVGKNANACGLRQHAWHFRCDVELEQRPCDAKSKNQVGCKWSRVTRAGIGLGHHVFCGSYGCVCHSSPHSRNSLLSKTPARRMRHAGVDFSEHRMDVTNPSDPALCRRARHLGVAGQTNRR